MRLIALMAVAACLGPVSALAAGAPADKSRIDPEAVVNTPKERIICEKITRIGSRIPERICRTESQIRAQREAAGEWTSRRQEEAARSGGLPPDVAGPG